jgi:hypothetical protein
MQERLASGPHAALGVPSTATVSEIRTAFLELTKTYHPARFGYMSSELQKLSNEVFLSLRAAHDALARPARAAAASKLDRSGVFPQGPRNDRSGVFPQAPQRLERSGGVPALAHTPAPHAGAPPSRLTPSPLPRSSSPSLASDARITPTSGVRIGAMRPASAGATTTPPAPLPALATRPGLARPPSIPGSPGGAARPEERELAAALEQLQRGQWDAARAILSALAARVPDVPRYRALLAYARGREAQLAQRLDEARVELQDALQIDPELQLAKTALAELFTRRK